MKAISETIITQRERWLARHSKAKLSDVNIYSTVVTMQISNSNEVAKKKSLIIRNRSWTLIRFWMSNCCQQLGLEPLRSRNQEGFYYRIKYFEYIEVIFQICAFSNLFFLNFCLFKLSAFSSLLPYQAFCLFRFSVSLGLDFSYIASTSRRCSEFELRLLSCIFTKLSNTIVAYVYAMTNILRLLVLTIQKENNN